LPSWEYTFRIGDAIPATDPVARFVAVLAMIYNDWRRTMASMAVAGRDPDRMGIRLLRFRQLVGYSHEATKFLKDSRERYPDTVDKFVRRLNEEALNEYDKVFTALAPVEQWARRQRNVTFHYPVMVPKKVEAGRDPFANALAAAAADKDTSSATFGPRYRDVRFDFADAIAVHLLGFKLPEQEDEFSELVQALREAHLALGHFVLAVVSTYLGWLPPGVTSSQVPRSMSGPPAPISRPQPESVIIEREREERG
jgi:hypothetical protein